MPFTFEDLLEVNDSESGVSRESFSASPDSFDIKNIFPELASFNNNNVYIAGIKLCSSLPTINKRGRCFTPAVMNNSFPSIDSQLVNIEHLMRDNQNSGEDKVVGYVVGSKLGLPSKLSAVEMANSPGESIPLFTAVALFKRCDEVANIVDQHSKRKNWAASMECKHKWRDANFYYRGEFIPIIDAESGMLECVKKTSVQRFKGHDLAVCLGGRNGSVNYSGIGMTTSPADKTAQIIGIYGTGMQEVANTGTISLSSIELNEGQTIDDIFEKEQANIMIIGKTKPSTGGDGHVHDILDDGTIMPANGHTHHLARHSIVTGSNPRLTGVTDTHRRYEMIDGTEQGFSHVHLVDIPLKGKRKTKDEPAPSGSGESTETSNSGEEMSKETEDRFNNIEDQIKKLTEGGNNELASTVQSVLDELRKESSEKKMKEFVDQEIASAIEAGELIKKEDHEKAVAKKIEEVRKELKDEAEANQIKESRLSKLRELGINDKTKIQGSDSTIFSTVESFASDEAGTSQFDLLYSSLKGALQKEANEDTEEEDDADEQANTIDFGKASNTIGRNKQAKQANTNRTGKVSRGRGVFSN